MNWRSIPIKRAFNVSRQTVDPSTLSDQPVFHYSLPSWHEIGDGKLESASTIASPKFVLRGGEILVSKLNPEKTVVIHAEKHNVPIVCSTEFIVLSPARDNVTHERFAYYLMLSAPIRHQLEASVESVTNSHKRARVDRFLASRVILPALPTQHRIAEFLDRETARIDGLIKLRRNMIELLDERLVSLITNAVNGSGVPGLTLSRTQTPIRLGHLVQINPPRGSIASLPKDTEVTFAPMEAIKDGIGGLDTSFVGPLGDLVKGSYSCFSDGDLLLAKVTPCFENGKKAIATGLRNGVGFATTEVHVIRLRSETIDRRYLNYVFCSAPFQHAGIASMTGSGGLKRVPEEAVLNYQLPVVELEAQRYIADYLDNEVTKVKSLRLKTELVIERLQELRSTLITAAVTGQIDVDTWRKRGNTERKLEAMEQEVQA